MQRWASRLGVLIVVWVLFVTAAALWLPHDWDWRVVSFVNAHHTPSFSQRVRIFDVTWDATDNSRNRRRIAGVLDRLVALGARPAAVALDVEFGPCDGPCSPAMESARKKLTASIRGATRLFPVYALEQPTVNHAEDEVVGPLPPHDATIYEAVSGAAHTRFTPLRTTNGIFYRACYRNVPYNGAPGALQVVWSMVDRLALAQMIQGGAPCDTSHVPVYLGEPLHRPGASVYQTSGASNEHFPDVVDDFVIVGTMGPQDQSVYADRSGPELLGWALSNALDLQLAMQIRTVYETRPHNEMLAFVIPAFGLISVCFFVAAFSVFGRIRLRSLRPALPWIASVGAAGMTLAVFAGFEALLFYALRIVQPQVFLVSLGIVLAAGLSGIRGNQILLDREYSMENRSEAPVDDYDVFISYAHEDKQWVIENVFRKFNEARLRDGKRLSVFFDVSSIRGGAAWQDRISLAIDASRFIVPVYTDVYFTRPYCAFEIRRAHRKWIMEGVDSRCVLPVMRGHPKIDKAVDDIEAWSVDDHPNIVDQYVAEVVRRVSLNAKSTPNVARSKPI